MQEELEVDHSPKRAPPRGCCIAIVAVVVLVVLVVAVLAAAGAGAGIYFAVIAAAKRLKVSGSVPPAGSRRAALVAPNIDYVYCVNTQPEHGARYRAKFPVAPDGSFSLQISKEEPWVIIFVDSSETGSDMVKCVLTATELDSLYATASADSEIVLGQLDTFNCDPANPGAEVGTNYNAYIQSLGLSASAASTLGGRDELMLRYSNPDMDGDGAFDFEQTDIPQVLMTLWLHYGFGSGTVNYVTDYIRAGIALPISSIPLTFEYTGPELRLHKIHAGLKPAFRTPPQKWTLEWSDAGDLDGVADHAEFSSTINSGPGASNLWGTLGFDNRPDEWSVKVTFDQSIANPPEGTYTYSFWLDEGTPTPDAVLTMTHVNTPEDCLDTDGFVFPFPIFHANAAGFVSTIDYTWKKYNLPTTAFTDATSEDVEMNMAKASAEIKWYDGGSDGEWANWEPYKVGFATTGTVGPHQVSSMKVAELTEVAISFNSISGIWFKLIIRDVV